MHRIDDKKSTIFDVLMKILLKIRQSKKIVALKQHTYVTQAIFQFLPKWGPRFWNKPRFWNTFADDKLVFQNRGFNVFKIRIKVTFHIKRVKKCAFKITATAKVFLHNRNYFSFQKFSRLFLLV